MRRAAVLAICLTLLVAACGSEKHDPGAAPGYQLQITFTAGPNSVKRGTPVRVAGVQIGRVTEVRRDGKPLVVAATLDRGKVGRIFKDSRFTLRQRITAPATWYVDLLPGAPSAGVVPDGERIAGERQALRAP